MMPLSISHQLIPSRGMAALMNHESSKNFSKSPNSSSSSIASTSGNSSCHSSSLHENQNQQVVANSIFVDVNNFSSGKKHQHNQLLDKFYQSLQAVDENGYKSAKYVERIEAVANLAGIGAGRGGYWEDSNDYAWYAGI